MSHHNKRSLSPCKTYAGATKRVRCISDLDRIVPELTTNSASTSTSQDLSVNISQVPGENVGKRPNYGDPVDRCKLKKAGTCVCSHFVDVATSKFNLFFCI